MRFGEPFTQGLGMEMVLVCSGNVFVTLINTMTKSNLEREGFIGLILPGYTPSLSGVRARTEVEQENIICCLVPSGLLSSHSVWPGPLCLGPAPPSSLVPTSGKSSNQESAPQTCPRAKLMKAILAVRCPHPR